MEEIYQNKCVSPIKKANPRPLLNENSTRVFINQTCLEKATALVCLDFYCIQLPYIRFAVPECCWNASALTHIQVIILQMILCYILSKFYDIFSFPKFTVFVTLQITLSTHCQFLVVFVDIITKRMKNNFIFVFIVNVIEIWGRITKLNLACIHLYHL